MSEKSAVPPRVSSSRYEERLTDFLLLEEGLDVIGATATDESSVPSDE